MSGYGFTEDSARRIVNAVRKVEGDTTPPVAVGPRFTGSQMSVVKVTSLGSPFAIGQRVDYNASANTRADINQVKIKEVNGATLTVGNYYVGLFSGYTTTDDPLFLVNVSGSGGGGGGNAVIEVVTDVVCTPTGIQVQTAQFSGKDYDTAVIRQFLSLTDVAPVSYLGQQNRLVKVNAAATALEFGLNAGTLEADISTIKANIASLQASVAAINASITEINANIVTLQNQMTGALNNITGMQNDIASLLTRVYALEHP